MSLLGLAFLLYFLKLSAGNGFLMNDIINKFVLVGDKFMPEMDLKQPQFNYSAR